MTHPQPTISPALTDNPHLKTIQSAAEAAATVQQERHDEITPEHKGRADLVTEADREAELEIREVIRNNHPDDSILGEEHGEIHTGDTEYTWIIDPIDGTTNYITGFPYYSVSIAVTTQNRVVAGGVYAPEFDQFYHAAVGSGAYCNEQELEPSTASYTDSVSLVEVHPSERDVPELHSMQRMLLDRTNGVRNIHSGALSLCLVADGTMDASVLATTKPWDIAAGVLITIEAGGTVTDWNGSEEWGAVRDGWVIATGGKMHTRLQETCSDVLNLYSSE